MRKFRWDRLFACLMVLASIMFGVWVVASYIDIASNNAKDTPVYQTWNLFVALWF